jgi:chromosome segregation ATPase
MKPEEPAGAPTQLLRQQLILAQVRIMELEDARDELAPRVADLEQLLAAAQRLADQKSAEAAHLESVRADLQRQFEHMRHMQHVTNQALEQTRADLQAAAGREQNLLDEVEQLQRLIAQQAELGRGLHREVEQLRGQLAAAAAESSARLARMQELDAEQRAMKASRSWRWTAWLRSLERRLASRRP